MFHTFSAGTKTPRESEVQFRRASTGELLTSWKYTYDTHQGVTVSVSPDGTQATLAAQTGQAVIFDVEAILRRASADEARTVYEDRTTGPNHQTMPLGDTFVTSGGGTEIRQWDTASGRLLAEVATDPGGPAALFALPDGSAIYYPDADGVVRRFLVDVADLVALAEARVPARVHRRRVRAVLRRRATARHPSLTDRSRAHRSGVAASRVALGHLQSHQDARNRPAGPPLASHLPVVLASDSVLPPELDHGSHHL